MPKRLLAEVVIGGAALVAEVQRCRVSGMAVVTHMLGGEGGDGDAAFLPLPVGLTHCVVLNHEGERRISLKCVRCTHFTLISVFCILYSEGGEMGFETTSVSPLLRLHLRSMFGFPTPKICWSQKHNLFSKGYEKEVGHSRPQAYFEHSAGSEILLLLLLHFNGDSADPFTLTPSRAVVALPAEILPTMLQVIKGAQPPPALLCEDYRV